jgi:hypothetical protein
LVKLMPGVNFINMLCMRFLYKSKLSSFSLVTFGLVIFWPGVNFINMLCMRFLYKSKLSSFSLVTFGLVIFWRKNIGVKGVHKMLMKLMPGVNFIKLLAQSKNVQVVIVLCRCSIFCVIQFHQINYAHFYQ